MGKITFTTGCWETRTICVYSGGVQCDWENEKPKNLKYRLVHKLYKRVD